MTDVPAPQMLGVDLGTSTTTVIHCDRTVVPLSEWLSEVLIACAATGRELQLVTRPTSRLTAPLVHVLRDAGYLWVVDDGERGEHYDGLTGVPLSWQGDAFRPLNDLTDPGEGGPVSRGYARPPLPDGRQLRLHFEILHAADHWTTLGNAFEAACRALTGQPPAGWGVAEPVDRVWRTSDLTTFARDHAPGHCWLIAVGAGEQPVIGTIEAVRVGGRGILESSDVGGRGILEIVELSIGYPASLEPPLAALHDLVDSLAHDHELRFLYAETKLARHDLTRPAYAEGLPLPVGLAVGPEGQTWLPADDPSAVRIGSPQRPTTWFALSQGDSFIGWSQLADVLAHLPGLPAPAYVEESPGG